MGTRAATEVVAAAKVVLVEVEIEVEALSITTFPSYCPIPRETVANLNAFSTDRMRKLAGVETTFFRLCGREVEAPSESAVFASHPTSTSRELLGSLLWRRSAILGLVSRHRKLGLICTKHQVSGGALVGGTLVGRWALHLGHLKREESSSNRWTASASVAQEGL